MHLLVHRLRVMGVTLIWSHVNVIGGDSTIFAESACNTDGGACGHRSMLMDDGWKLMMGRSQWKDLREGRKLQSLDQPCIIHANDLNHCQRCETISLSCIFSLARPVVWRSREVQWRHHLQYVWESIQQGKSTQITFVLIEAITVGVNAHVAFWIYGLNVVETDGQNPAYPALMSPG